ncbi:hypothetical protein VF_2607 [Aliivibrio fischeri ES114]|uniref:Uncharacterized protein n=1 Tax=Aliivibrio fischeri (strain ATCC 700601 / ES114) TaxID=312309 RepID=B1WN15_ALIF1|nr:hypothetical protein VF_2607 [Aliivibrio fischeri ES114]
MFFYMKRSLISELLKMKIVRKVELLSANLSIRFITDNKKPSMKARLWRLYMFVYNSKSPKSSASTSLSIWPTR